MNFGLYLNNGQVELVDLSTGEILAEDRYSVWMWLRAYENNFTLTLIQGLTNQPLGCIIKTDKGKGSKQNETIRNDNNQYRINNGNAFRRSNDLSENFRSSLEQWRLL